MNRKQVIQAIVARKLTNSGMNKNLCFAQKALCFASAERTSRPPTAKLPN